MGKYLNSLILALGLASAGQLGAAPIYGTFGINGSVQVGALFFDWAPLGGGNGTVTIGALGNTGYFATLGGTALIDDLTSPEGTPGNPVSPFLSGFTGVGFGGLLVNQALFVAPSAPLCVGPIAVSSSCSVGNSLLTQVDATSVTVSTNFTVEFVNGADGPTAGTAAFTTQLNNNTVGDILTTLNGGGTINATFSGTFSSIPEPATYGLMGAALAALALRARMRR